MPSENCDLLAAYREQEVEVAFGPLGVLKDCDVGTLARRIDADQVVRVTPSPRGNSKQPTSPKTPHVTELLRKAIEWQTLLESGEAVNQTDIACQEGISRARVTQVMGMLRLAPEIQERILSMPDGVGRASISERLLRPFGTIADQRDQIREFQKLLV